MGRKEYLAKAMTGSGLHALGAFLRALIMKELPILAYHRVYDITDEALFPFDPELVSASVAGFRWQMEYIRQRYEPITFQTLLDVLDGSAVLPERPVIVTFDDGYDDNYYNAFPVLRSFGIPATVFVSTGYIGQGKPFWFDLVAHILFRIPVGAVSLKGFDMDLRVDDDVESRRTATAKLIGALKRVSNQCRLEFLNGFEREYSYVVDGDGFERSRPLDWSHVREMSAAGIEFGSHTVTHPILSKLDDDTLERELVLSKETLERELGKPMSILAYPVGGPEEFNEKVVEVAQAVGYRAGVSYVPGVNKMDHLDRFRLRRQHVERYTTADYFSGLLSWPEVFR